MTGNNCGCGERREYMTLGEYMALYPNAYAEATEQMTERQKRLFELRFSDRLLYLPKDESVQESPVDPSQVDIKDVTIDGVTGVSYDPDAGDALFEYNGAKVQYIDRRTGEEKTDDIENVSLVLPIGPGKYISIGTDNQSAKLKIGIDETKLALEFIKIDKDLNNVVPLWYNGKINWYKLTSVSTENTVVYRDGNGDSSFNTAKIDRLTDKNGRYSTPISYIYYGVVDADLFVPKKNSDTGILDTESLRIILNNQQVHIRYKDQIYYRMDPTSAPDGTLNYVHLDTIQDGKRGYKATGKAFSVTVSTGAWQVVDIDFAGSGGETPNVFLHHVSFVGTNGHWYSFDVTTHNAAELTFSDLVTQLDGITVNGLQAESSSTATNITPAIVRANGADNRIEIVSTDFAVISSYSEAQIESVSDMVTEIAPAV